MNNSQHRNYKDEINSIREKLSSGTSSSRPVVTNEDRREPLEYILHRAAIISTIKSEQEKVIRDALYALRGISGELISFENGMDDDNDLLGHSSIKQQSATVVNLSLPPDCIAFSKLGSCGVAAKGAIAICCEVGCMYNRIQSYIDRTNRQNNGLGCVARAFAAALSHEMQSYRNFLVQLEERTLNSSMDSEQSIQHIREIVIAIQTPFRKLKTLAILTDSLSYHTSKSCHIECREQFGAPVILTALHRHGNGHGDTRHASILHSLLQESSRPWFDMLYDWCMEGRLSDPSNEFFVTASGSVVPNASSSGKKAGVGFVEAQYLWQKGYNLDVSKVPRGILDSDLVDQVFVVGKGVNYIRQCLQHGEWSIDSEWLLQNLVDENHKDDSREGSNLRINLGFCYSLPVSSTFHATNYKLRRTLETSAFLVHTHILNSIRTEHNLMQHLYALKQFLLLGQGDFFSALMDGLYTESECNNEAANNGLGFVGIYRHSLAAIVESALRSTNATSFSHDILDRLQVELISDGTSSSSTMFGSSSSDAQTIWDVFLLEYIMHDPLVAVVHNASMESYKRLFRLLFGLKRIEFMLNLTWRQSAGLQHALHLQAQHMGLSLDSNRQYAKANTLLRQVSMTRQAMMHFVGNLKSYLMFEVLEGSWNDLVRALDGAQTLDEVIHAHDNYLSSILRKSLLGYGTATGHDRDSFAQLARKIANPLQLADTFCSYQQGLFGLAQEEADVAAEKRREAEKRTNMGDWGFEEVAEEDFFGLSDDSKLNDLDLLSKEFNQQVYELLKALDSKLNGGPAWTTSLSDESVSSPTQLDNSVRYDLHENSLSDQDDLDCLRFLIFQLDNNKYYGIS